jgi:hypothetical protein
MNFTVYKVFIRLAAMLVKMDKEEERILKDKSKIYHIGDFKRKKKKEKREHV